MAKADSIITIERFEPGENLIPLNGETFQQFTDDEGNLLFGETEESGEVVCTADYKLVYLNATDIVTGTQPDVRSEHSGMSVASIKELAESLHTQGQIQPITVRVFLNNDTRAVEYHLIAGGRRTQAALMNAESGRDSVLAAMIRIVDNDEAKALALAENVSREDMTPLEKASHIEAGLNATKWNVAKTAKLLGIGRPTVSDYSQILKACETDPNFSALWKSGKLAYTAALVLAQQEDRETRSKIYNKALEIEVAKAKAVTKAAEEKAAATGKPATKTASPSTPSGNTNKGVGASKDAVSNAAKGAVSKASLDKAAAEITQNKPKYMSGRQVVEMFRGEISEALFDARVVMAFAQICGVIEGTIPEDSAGLAFQTLRSCIRPEWVKKETVQAAAKPATKTAAKPATKTAAKG